MNRLLTGNDVEGDEAPSGPVKTVDKTIMRGTKRNVEPQAPVKPVANTGARRSGPGGNEGGQYPTYLLSLHLHRHFDSFFFSPIFITPPSDEPR